MHKILFFLCLLCSGTIAVAQVSYPYRDIKLEKPSDYKETEKLAVSAATFLITTPFTEKDANRDAAFKFLNSWINGTKDYQFYFGGKVLEIIDDSDLVWLFVAAMAKYTFENKVAAANPITVEQNASKIVLAYSDDPKNNFKLKKKYRKILEKN
jgi:hypothetical protein